MGTWTHLENRRTPKTAGLLGFKFLNSEHTVWFVTPAKDNGHTPLNTGSSSHISYLVIAHENTRTQNSD